MRSVVVVVVAAAVAVAVGRDADPIVQAGRGRLRW